MEEILSSIRRIIADEEAEEGRGDEDARDAADPALDDLDPAADDDEDVLELTKVVREGGEVVDLQSGADGLAADHDEPVPEPVDEAGEDTPPALGMPPESGPEAEVQAEPETEPEPWPEHDASEEDQIAVPKQVRDELLSDAAATAVTGAFAKLSKAYQRTPSDESIADGDGRTVEQFVEDMVRPLLMEWLDERLPPIIERLVEKEIQKIARRAELR